MKKLLLIFIFLHLLFENVFAHKQHVHQYITSQAYYLLRNQVGCDIPEMVNHLDNGPVGPPWENGTLNAGAWREDEEDVVFRYFQIVPADPGSLISISHFWDADRGDISDNNFDVSWWFFTGRIGPYHNAYQKMMAYRNGGWEVEGNTDFLFKYNGVKARLVETSGRSFRKFYYDDLINLYKNGNIKIINVAAGRYIIDCESGSDFWISPTNGVITLQLNNDVKNKIVWEILGRMCHLVEDMSVPAHTRCDQHGFNPKFDDYENWVSENNHWTYWNSNNCGALLDPYISSNPLHFLMYTTQQIGNHFGSTGPYCSVGNNVIGGNPLPEEINYLNSVNLSSLGDPTGQGPFYDVTETNIRNKTFPQAIRATAGLLYWFTREADLIPDQFTVNISRVFEFDQTENLTPQNSQGCPVTLTAQSPYPKNGRDYIFAGWSDGNGENPRTVTSNLTVSALYKMVHKSNDAAAFTNNSARKIVETEDGVMFQTYTSTLNGKSHVFLECSFDKGITWQLMKTLNGSAYMDWTGQGKCPSLDWASIEYSVTVVFQASSSSGSYEIDYRTFIYDESSPSIYHEYNKGTIYTEPSGGDAYTVNANPAIAIGYTWSDDSHVGPSFILAFERKKSLTYQSGTYNSGINLTWGYMDYAGRITVKKNLIGPKQITTTTASSTLSTISAYRNELSFHLAYEQDVDQYTSTIKYSLLELSENLTQCTQLDNPPIQLSSSSYMRNSNPSIAAAPNNGWYACWIAAANPSVAPKCAYTNFNATPTIWYFANYVTSVSINMANYSSTGYVAWNQNMTHVNQLVNIANVNSIANLNTTGNYIQVSNGPTKNDMRVSSFYTSASPYYWNTSQSLGSLLPKEVAGAVASGRGCAINYGNADFLYTFGDLNVDGQNVGFVDLPDNAKLTGIASINSVLLSEPFNMSKDSRVSFSELSGFADSSASAGVLGKNGFIGCRVELLDNSASQVISTLENTSFKAENLCSAKMTPYLLNTKNIKGGTFRIRITLSTNLDGAEVRLVENRALENLSSGSDNSLSNLKIEMITEYSLEQNYPNPFNPSTTISYQIPTEGLVTLKIFDVLGREVKTLVNEYKGVGRYEVEFDATDLSSGLYIYQLRANEYISTKKMMLLK